MTSSSALTGTDRVAEASFGLNYDIFVNDKEYPFLEKIFDSNELDMKYHVKIYKINYEMMNSKD